MYCSVRPKRTSRKKEKGPKLKSPSESNARSFMPRGGSLDGSYDFGIGLTHVSGFEVGAEVTLLSD